MGIGQRFLKLEPKKTAGGCIFLFPSAANAAEEREREKCGLCPFGGEMKRDTCQTLGVAKAFLKGSADSLALQHVVHRSLPVS